MGHDGSINKCKKLNDKIHERKVPDELRPVCVCGKRMKFIRYTHYYGERWFWDCSNKKCILNEYDFEPDEEERESY